MTFYQSKDSIVVAVEEAAMSDNNITELEQYNVELAKCDRSHRRTPLLPVPLICSTLAALVVLRAV